MESHRKAAAAAAAPAVAAAAEIKSRNKNTKIRNETASQTLDCHELSVGWSAGRWYRQKDEKAEGLTDGRHMRQAEM